MFFFVFTFGGLLVQCQTVLSILNALSHVVAVHDLWVLSMEHLPLSKSQPPYRQFLWFIFLFLLLSIRTGFNWRHDVPEARKFALFIDCHAW